MNRFLYVLVVMLLGLFVACGSPQKKQPKLDREILGAELEFGRDAAKADLWNEAIFRWEKVVKAQPENPEAVNNLAVAYESVGNYDRAKDLYRNALELDEDSAAIRRNYKRFLNFYKRHQKQLAREQKKEKADDEQDTASVAKDDKN